VPLKKKGGQKREKTRFKGGSSYCTIKKKSYAQGKREARREKEKKKISVFVTHEENPFSWEKRGLAGERVAHRRRNFLGKKRTNFSHLSQKKGKEEDAIRKGKNNLRKSYFWKGMLRDATQGASLERREGSRGLGQRRETDQRGGKGGDFI